jgi:hypothetical protein
MIPGSELSAPKSATAACCAKWVGTEQFRRDGLPFLYCALPLFAPGTIHGVMRAIAFLEPSSTIYRVIGWIDVFSHREFDPLPIVLHCLVLSSAGNRGIAQV